jgi:hypothetical protein
VGYQYMMVDVGGGDTDVTTEYQSMVVVKMGIGF